MTIRRLTIAACLAAAGLVQSTYAQEGQVVRSVETTSGLVIEFYDNGDRRITRTDGSVRLISTRGYEQVTQPDGTVVRTFDDGTVVTQSNDGNTYVSRPDGSASVQNGGYRLHTYPDGTVIAYFPDGRRVTENPDGSTQTVYPDGRVVSEPPPATGGGDNGGGDTGGGDNGGGDPGDGSNGGSDGNQGNGDSGGDAPADTSGDFQSLAPGLGFSGPPEIPPRLGLPGQPGYDAKAIARWNVVPFQDFGEDGNDFVVGVVAFHINGIDRVDFIAEGGSPVSVTELKMNSRTGTAEYAVRLDPALFADGRIELRAVVYPDGTGIPRVLGGDIDGTTLRGGNHSMVVYNNAGGSLSGSEYWVSPNGSDENDGSRDNPFRTIQHAGKIAAAANGGTADGSTAYLLPGEHKLGPYSFGERFATGERWFTVAPDPDSDPTEVLLIGSEDNSGLGVSRLKVKDMYVRASTNESIFLTRSSPESFLFLENCDMQGPGAHTSMQWIGGFTASFVLGGEARSCRDGPANAVLARGLTIRDLGSDAYSGIPMVVNCRVIGVDHGTTGFHPDIYQIYAPGQHLDNLIVYGMIAQDFTSQGIFARGLDKLTNSAFVNCVLDQADGQVGISQWRVPVSEHILFWHITHQGMGFQFRRDEQLFSGDPVMKDISVHGCFFDEMGSEYPMDPAYFSHNHYAWSSFNHVDDSTTGVVGGFPTYTLTANWFNGIRVPQSGSSADNRIPDPKHSFDIVGRQRGANATIGAVEVD
ncbi:MAG: hypothetical protein AAGB51_00655 [Planctomycetota bacterium]